MMPPVEECPRARWRAARSSAEGVNARRDERNDVVLDAGPLAAEEGGGIDMDDAVIEDEVDVVPSRLFNELVEPLPRIPIALVLSPYIPPPPPLPGLLLDALWRIGNWNDLPRVKLNTFASGFKLLSLRFGFVGDVVIAPAVGLALGAALVLVPGDLVEVNQCRLLVCCTGTSSPPPILPLPRYINSDSFDSAPGCERVYCACA